MNFQPAKIAIALTCVLLFSECSKVPITGRRQMNLVPESEMSAMSATAYQDFLAQNDPLPASDVRAKQVAKVGARISKAVEQYMNDNGMSKNIESFDWSFNTVEDAAVNAWCMPGGRVVFYTGILPICEDETGIAVVMGHEVAHAVAKHGNERMSQGLLVQGAGMTLNALTNQQPELSKALLMQSFGLGSSLGTLAFSRSHETEADKMGLVFMAMAGYDPREAPKFWVRMASGGGGSQPEFLSTHPKDDRRVDDLEAYMPEALKYYNP